MPWWASVLVWQAKSVKTSMKYTLLTRHLRVSNVLETMASQECQNINQIHVTYTALTCWLCVRNVLVTCL